MAPERGGPRASAGTHATLSGLITDQSEGRERVAVTIAVDPGWTDRMTSLVTRLGGRVANRSGLTVEAYVPVAALVDLARAPGVAQVRPILPDVAAKTVADAATLHGAPAWSAMGYTGRGIKVGIIDGGFAGLSSRLESLPVRIVPRCYSAVGAFTETLAGCETGGFDHGTAVLESLVAMLPRATVYISNAPSRLDIQATIDWMTANGVKVISASWTSVLFEGPGDGTSGFEGSLYTLIDRAVSQGALWVNSASNNGESNWTGPWRDDNGDGWMDWASGDDQNVVDLGAGEPMAVSIRWADPWGASANDYALCIFPVTGSAGPILPIACANDVQNGSGLPREGGVFVAPYAGRFDVSVKLVSGSATSRLQLLTNGVRLEHRVADGGLPSPADSRNPGMVVAGAVGIDTPDVVEPFSSRGPTVDGRIKPDLVAADCALTTVWTEPFCGTSQSAPFVAGAAGLVLKAHPAFTPQQLAKWLVSHATPLGTPVPNNAFGAGRLNLGAAPSKPPVEPPPVLTLAFQQGTNGGTAGAPFPIQPVVKVLDELGHLATSGPGNDAWVALSIGTNGGGGALNCTGGTRAQASAGVATFAGCYVIAPGNGYTLVASSRGADSATSSPFAVAPGGAAPPELSLVAAPTTLVHGGSVTLTAQLVATGAPLEGLSIEFQSSPDGIGWTAMEGVLMDSTGLATLTNGPETNADIRAVFPGASGLSASISEPVRVKVAQAITLKPSNAGKTKVVRKGASVTFTATVRPAWDDPKGKVSFLFYRKVGSAWRLAARKDGYASASGVAKLTWKFTTTGQWQVRALANRTLLNEASAPSAVQRYDVK